jgi:transposase
MVLANEQWAMRELLLPEQEWTSTLRRGRPWRDSREVMNGIFWVLRTRAPWKDLPKRYPPYPVRQRRFPRWVERGMVDAIAVRPGRRPEGTWKPRLGSGLEVLIS